MALKRMKQIHPCITSLIWAMMASMATITHRGSATVSMTPWGLDMTMLVCQWHGVDTRGHVVLTKCLSQAKVRSFVAQLPPCHMGMEASEATHNLAREYSTRGGSETVRRYI
jgi:hypothetical protein